MVTAQVILDSPQSPQQKYNALIQEAKYSPEAASAATGYKPPEKAPVAPVDAGPEVRKAEKAAQVAAYAAKQAAGAAQASTSAAQAAVPAAKASVEAANSYRAGVAVEEKKDMSKDAGGAPVIVVNAGDAGQKNPPVPVAPKTEEAYRAGVATTPPVDGTRDAGTVNPPPVDKKTEEPYREGVAVTPDLTRHGLDSASRNYQGIGDAYKKDLKGFASYMRDLADKGELFGADGKQLPMYSRDKIESMSAQELQKFVDDNPRYATGFFGKIDPNAPSSFPGKGTSMQVTIPDPSKSTPEEAAKKIVDDDPTKKNMPPKKYVAHVNKVKKIIDEEDGEFAKGLKDLSKKWGLSLLEALQAGMLGYIGGKTGNWQQTAYQARIAREERDKAAEAEKVARQEEMKSQDARLIRQIRATSQLANMERIANAIALDKSLSMQEKIARLQATQRAAGLPVSADAAAADLLGF